MKLKKEVISFVLAGSLVLGGVSYLPNGDAAGNMASAAGAIDLTNGLVGYYPFDGSLDNMVSTNGGKATLHGGAGDTWNADATGEAAYNTGKKDKAYSFSGDVSGARGEGLQLDVNTGKSFTISAWVNTAEKVNYQPIFFTTVDAGDKYVTAGTIYNDYASGGIVAMGADRDTMWTWLDKNDPNTASSVKDLELNKWTHITLTLDDATGKAALYYNGEVLSQKDVTSYASGTFENLPIFLGVNYWDQSFKGMMDDVAVYNRALSAEEITELYTNGINLGTEDEPTASPTTSPAVTESASPATGSAIPSNPEGDVNTGTTPTNPAASTAASQAPGASQSPAASQAPGASQSPAASQAPGTSQSPDASQAPDDGNNSPDATQAPDDGNNPVATPTPDIGNDNNNGGNGNNTSTAPKKQTNVTAAAQNGVTIKVNTKKNGTAVISTVKKTNKKTVTISNKVTVNGVKYTVTTIGANAFAKCTKATKINLPSTITTINKNAFSGAKKLKTIKITSKKAVTVKKGAFKGLNTKKMTVKVSKKNMSKKKFQTTKKNLKKAGFKGKIKRV